MDASTEITKHEVVLSAINQQQPPQALAAIHTALGHTPQDPWLLVKKAEVLTALGRPAEAQVLLQRLRRDRPGNAPVAVALAKLHLAAHEHSQAEALYQAVLEQQPGHRGALAGLIDTALALGDGQLALQRCQQALAAFPADPILLEQQGVVLLQCNQPAEAAQVFQALADEQPSRPLLQLRLAGALRLSGDPEGSARLCEQVLEREPAHRLAQLNLIEAVLAAGDPDRALSSCAAALQHHPADPQLLRLQARALRRVGRAEQAVAVLEPLLQATPQNPALTIELARAQQEAGQRAAAGVLLDGLLQQQPQHLGAAIARADLAEQAGDRATALAALERAAGPGDLSEVDPQLLLRLLELAHQAGDAVRTRQAHAAVHSLHGGGGLGPWSEGQLLRLCRAVSATDEQALLAIGLGELRSRQHLQPDTALYLVRKAHATGDRSLSTQLSEALADRVPPGQRPSFAIEAALICQGPEAAYQLARASRSTPRQPPEALRLARLMRQCGRNPLARRYLARCLRVWPQAAALRHLYAEACLHSGRAELLAPLLEELEACGRASEAAELRLLLLLETGALEQAHALILEQQARGLPAGIRPAQRLQLLLSLGRLPDAEALVAQHGRSLFPSHKGAMRTRMAESGRRLNELRLYAIEAAAGEADADLAERLVFPAQQVVARWLEANPADAPPAEEAAPAIPLQIMQYWDTPAIPAEVAAVMESWQHAPGFSYTRLDKRAARAFLKEEYGPEHLRAFQLANSAAMASDFLRLCWLQARGGIVADADDKLIGDLTALLPPAAGLGLWREPWGAILNNLIVARPGHPVLQRAVAMACQALLQGDNDSPWSKTGPGLLTRAVATYLTRPSTAEAAQELCIHERHEVYPIVQMHLRLSYKGTPRYWNAIMRDSTAMVRQALASVTQAPGPPSGA